MERSLPSSDPLTILQTQPRGRDMTVNHIPNSVNKIRVIFHKVHIGNSSKWQQLCDDSFSYSPIGKKRKKKDTRIQQVNCFSLYLCQHCCQSWSNTHVLSISAICGRDILEMRVKRHQDSGKHCSEIHWEGLTLHHG